MMQLENGWEIIMRNYEDKFTPSTITPVTNIVTIRPYKWEYRFDTIVTIRPYKWGRGFRYKITRDIIPDDTPYYLVWIHEHPYITRDTKDFYSLNIEHAEGSQEEIFAQMARYNGRCSLYVCRDVFDNISYIDVIAIRDVLKSIDVDKFLRKYECNSRF